MDLKKAFTCVFCGTMRNKGEHADYAQEKDAFCTECFNPMSKNPLIYELQVEGDMHKLARMPKILKERHPTKTFQYLPGAMRDASGSRGTKFGQLMLLETILAIA